jgi:hypothetical protein
MKTHVSILANLLYACVFPCILLVREGYCAVVQAGTKVDESWSSFPLECAIPPWLALMFFSGLAIHVCAPIALCSAWKATVGLAQFRLGWRIALVIVAVFATIAYAYVVLTLGGLLLEVASAG